MINEKNIVEIKQELSTGQRVMIVDGKIFPVGLDRQSGNVVRYGYINDDGLFQALDLSGDIPATDGEAAAVTEFGIYRTSDNADALTLTLDASTAAATVSFASSESGGTNRAPDHIRARDIYCCTEAEPDWKPFNDGSVTLDHNGNSWVKFWNKADRCSYSYYKDGSETISCDALTFAVETGGGGGVHASGNLNSLRNFNTGALNPYEFCHLFSGCTALLTAPELPATVLADHCYYRMFNECSGLTLAPELPATTLAEYCYSWMFSKCTKLTAAPELPATILANHCYHYTFAYCHALTAAPELPATTLAEYCYKGMFFRCEQLAVAPELPALTLANSCYDGMFEYCTKLTVAPLLPATILADECYAHMFKLCRKLAAAPELPATTLAERCYTQMFYSCDALTAAPELPATTLAEYCYNGMFQNCTALTEIRLHATGSWWNNSEYWVENISAKGTLYCSASAVPDAPGVHTYPANWNVQAIY